jgi:hypothetical protein
MGRTCFGTHLAPLCVINISVGYTCSDITSTLFGDFIIKCQVTCVLDIEVSRTNNNSLHMYVYPTLVLI